MAFWQDYKWVILFYSAIILLIYIFRNKLDIQHKVMAFYRTKVGLKTMDSLGKKHTEFIKFLLDGCPDFLRGCILISQRCDEVLEFCFLRVC